MFLRGHKLLDPVYDQVQKIETLCVRPGPRMTKKQVIVVGAINRTTESFQALDTTIQISRWKKTNTR